MSSSSSRQCILKLACLGQPVLTDVKVEASVVGKTRKKLNRKQRPEEKYVVSRWAPIIQDIMEVGLVCDSCEWNSMCSTYLLSHDFCSLLIPPYAVWFT